MTDARSPWRDALQPGNDCIAIERLGEALTPREHAHIAQCQRCQAEMALWEEFDNPATTADESEATDWIKDELHRRNPRRGNVVRFASWKNAMRPRSLAVAATLVFAVAIGYVMQTREPSIDVQLTETSAYRSARVEGTAPRGDLTAAPSELRWASFSGASSYDVEVMEIDRTPLWRTSTSATRLELPSNVTAQFVPGKTIVWQVTARNGATALADSGMQKFRVKPR